MAAKQLAVTQSSITIAIKNLESELGSPLFDRSVHGVRLTEKGQRVFELLNQQQKLISETLLAREKLSKPNFALGNDYVNQNMQNV